MKIVSISDCGPGLTYTLLFHALYLTYVSSSDLGSIGVICVDRQFPKPLEALIKTRHSTYGDSDINMPPLDSHFRTRTTAPRPLPLLDGAYNVSVYPTADHELDMSGSRTISGGNA